MRGSSGSRVRAVAASSDHQNLLPFGYTSTCHPNLPNVQGRKKEMWSTSDAGLFYMDV
jgi:hypothetical protein